MFEAFGIAEPAERLYRLLVRDPQADPAALPGPPHLVQEALDELARRGLLETGSARSGSIKVVPPERAVELLIAQEEAALDRRRQALSAARGSVEDLVADFVDGRRQVGSEFVEEVRGGDAVRSRLYQLSQNCSREVCSVNPGPAPPPEHVAASQRMDAQSRARGVLTRAIFSGVAAADSVMAAYLAESVDAGDDVRIHPAPPLRMLLIDGTVGVIPADEDNHGRGAYVLHGNALLTPLTVLFDTLWQAGERFDPTEESLAATEEARLRQVVALLAEGLKDETIARRLGISVRTVRRLIALAIERLQAESRFQAGVLAVRNGWIDG